MECHDARLLLAFARRKSEELDATERSALEAHVQSCPDCIAFSQADQQADATLARLMHAVPVPAELKGKVLARVAANRPRKPWKWLTAAAAAILLCASAGAGWYLTLPTELTLPMIHEYETRWDKKSANE